MLSYTIIFGLLIVSHETGAKNYNESAPIGKDIVKICLFHEVIYEMHTSRTTPCSFIVPKHIQEAVGKYAPHDPECFDEIVKHEP